MRKIVKLWLHKSTLISFVALAMRSEGNAPKNGNTAVGFSFTTMFQHTGQFWSRISSQRTIWQHWNILHTRRTFLQPIFTCSLDWYLQWRNSAFVMLLTSLRMRWQSWKWFYKMASRNVSNVFAVAGRNV